MQESNFNFCAATLLKNFDLALMILTLPLNEKSSFEMPFKQMIVKFLLIQWYSLFCAYRFRGRKHIKILINLKYCLLMIIRTGIICKKILLWKSIEFCSSRLAINKKQNYFLLPDHQLAKCLILVSGFYKGQEK